LAANLFCQLEGQKLKIRLGNRVNRIQHAIIMLESEVPHFFPKMHLQFYREPFCIYASSLLLQWRTDGGWRVGRSLI